MLLDKALVTKFSKDNLCSKLHKVSFKNSVTNVTFVPLSLLTFVGWILIDVLVYLVCVCVCVCVCVFVLAGVLCVCSKNAGKWKIKSLLFRAKNTNLALKS